MKRATLSSLFCMSIVASTGACGSDDNIEADNGDAGAEDAGEGQGNALLRGPSRGSSIAVSEDGTLLAVANKGTDDVSIYALPDVTEVARVEVGDEPVSVSWAADNKTIFVVNRADGTVSKINNADTDAAAVANTLRVGSEPTHGALSPTGASLYVGNMADGTLSIINTATMELSETLALGGAPYAVCVTNNGDASDDDETIFVTDFYGTPSAGASEGTDLARSGRVFRVSAGDLEIGTTSLAVQDSGIPGFEETKAYPNQLYSCAISGQHLYVTSVGASPAAFAGGTDFHQNLQGLVSAVDIDTGSEVPSRSVSLNSLVAGLSAPKRFVAIPADIAFVEDTEFGYIASMASNSVLRMNWSEDEPVAGASSGASFLATDPSPTGIAITGSTAYVYNEVARSVSVLDLALQETAQQSIAVADQPVAKADQDILRGQKFFNTGLKRWSVNGWVSCAGCHPAGTTDNVTWVFPAGPRQSIDLTATFDKSGSVQRILNWSAIFDEVHDFELNTRGVAGGTGAIVSDNSLNADGTPKAEVRINFVGAGGVANPENGFNIGSSRAVAISGAVPNDWDDIESYIRSLRSPRAASTAGGDAAAGRVVFEAGNCQNCHGGALWTLSERYYEPTLDTDFRTTSLLDTGIANLGSVRADQVSTTDTSLLNVLANDSNGPPARHVCVVRKVGTFGELGPLNRGAAELRQNGGNAQGVDGFNVPSLLGTNTGAPFMHNGAAESLDELLDPTGSFASHLQAGNQVFAPNEQQRLDLIAFLRSIDDTTATIAVPAAQRFCPTGI